MAQHTVAQGECLSSIAKHYGFASYKTIYDHPNNAAFKQKRPNPNLIYPGDVLFIPEKDPKEFSKGTDNTHKFELDREEVKLRIVVKDDKDQPLANMRYQLKIGSQKFEGTTGGDGKIEQDIPVEATSGDLAIFPSGGGGTQNAIGIFSLEIGHLDPVEESTGVQARLNNLGFDCGSVDGVIGPKTQEALKGFQKKYGLSETGNADTATRNKLRELHDWS